MHRGHRIPYSMLRSSTSWWTSQRRRLHARSRCHCTIEMLIHPSLVSEIASGRQCARGRHRSGRRIRESHTARESSPLLCQQLFVSETIIRTVNFRAENRLETYSSKPTFCFRARFFRTVNTGLSRVFNRVFSFDCFQLNQHKLL